MGWAKMRFRDQEVWVKVDLSGRPVLDGTGRAEMKYRETDEKSYRPAAVNLTRIEGAEGAPRDLAVPARRNARGPAKRPALPDALPGAIDVWTDGACSGNPGPMGIGVVVLFDGQRKELGEYLGEGTNNIAELVAIERGLDAAAPRLSAPERTGPARMPVKIHSDSGYALGLLGKGWKAKANQEVVARIRRRVAEFPAPITWVKVAGHAGIAENERCDELARRAIIERASSRHPRG